MSTLAKIVPIPKGAYSATVTYNALDIVKYNGGTYICRVDGTTGTTPVDGNTWMLLSQDSGIDDTIISTLTTWSSSKITSYINDMITDALTASY